jgi:hypothetical protein
MITSSALWAVDDDYTATGWFAVGVYWVSSSKIPATFWEWIPGTVSPSLAE